MFIHRAENPESCSCSRGRAPGQDWALLTTCPFQSLSSPSSEEQRQSSPALPGAAKTLLLPWNSPLSCRTEPASAACCLPRLSSLLAPFSWSSLILSGKSQKKQARHEQGKSQKVLRIHLGMTCHGRQRALDSFHGMVEWLRLEKPSKSIKSNHSLSTAKVTTDLCPQVPHPRGF